MYKPWAENKTHSYNHPDHREWEMAGRKKTIWENMYGFSVLNQQNFFIYIVHCGFIF